MLSNFAIIIIIIILTFIIGTKYNNFTINNKKHKKIYKKNEQDINFFQDPFEFKSDIN